VISILDIIFILFGLFCIGLWVDSIGDKEREEYLGRIRLLRKAINNKKSEKLTKKQKDLIRKKSGRLRW